ncbi:MAG: hypothetical protein JSW07_20275 [bacterium]|nr:MAG: hypothetical protein JSW07_20275 [bacterium]
MSDIAILGDKDTIWPFKAFGFDLFPIVKLDNAEAVLEDTIKKRYKIIFVTEDLYKKFRDQIIEAQLEPLPAIMVIPNIKGSQDIGKKELRQAIRTAIGSDII